MRSAWVNQNATAIKDRAQLAPIDPDKVYENGGHWYDDINNVKVVNSGTKTPRPTLSDPNDNDRLSTRYIEDGSFLRLQNLTIGYTLPQRWTRKIYVSKLRLYATAENLFCLTKYTGYDPEVNVSRSALMPGFDYGAYPKSKVFTAGVEINF